MRGVNRQPTRMVRPACPRFPAGMREAIVWRRGVRSYDDLPRAYAERISPAENRRRPSRKPPLQPRTSRTKGS